MGSLRWMVLEINMPASSVSIIVPNYNGEALLEKNLPAVLKALEKYTDTGEVIVVDDGSRDKSADLITTRFPLIRLLTNEMNKGFAETIHTGVQHAVNEFLILLNSDVHPDPDFIAPLMEHFNNPATFSVSPLICDPDGSPQTVSWNIGVMRRGSIKFRPWDLAEAEERVSKGKTLKSLFASGGSVALRKSMFHSLGGFLSLYKPFYYEDVDLCTRAWLNGWQTLFEPRSRVIHDHVGVIRKHFHSRRIRVTRLRNRFFYLWLYLSGKSILTSHIPGILYRLLFRTLQLDMAYMTALIQACKQLKEVNACRTRLKIGKENTNSLEKLLMEIK
ncbi:MAG TPA: glycosyltransferase family 2 protein [Desulfobacteraceae bacterium]|nr:glycosyltransferase family 2 protein [Desulfobacteraceae bacterium]